MQNSEKLVLPVPPEISHPFLREEKEAAWAPAWANDFQAGAVFIYEIAFYQGIEALRPWENADGFLPVQLDEWGKEKSAIRSLHEKRERSGLAERMRSALGLFLQMLFWTNGQPVNLAQLGELYRLDIMPPNLKERLDFILSKPLLYHSFIQLCELQAELEKQRQKKLAIEKAFKHKA
jgi:hypothetical protein